MSLRDRDKKLIAGIVPVILIVAYWMLFFSPKRDEASKAGKDLSAAQQKRDEAVGRAGQLTEAKANYASDYESVVRLGKAIPPNVDTPSLIVQLDRAARGTEIDFTVIKVGDRQSAPQSPSTPAPASGGTPAAGNASSGASGSSTPPVAAGGQQAQSGPGKAAETANNGASTANAASNAAAGTSADTNSQTSQNVSGGKGLPVGGGDTTAASTTTGSAAPGLDSIPLEFEFNGSFFDLADFFHRMKRFVHVVNDRIMVRGRLMTIDTVSFKSEDHFPVIKAQLGATVYLAPKDEGVTAGATLTGPAGATSPSSPSSPAPSTPPASQSAAGSAPAATVVPR